MKISVLIADDNKLFSELLANRLMESAHIESTTVTASRKEIVTMVENIKPDIVLMDVDASIMKGIETIQLIYQVHPSTKIIALTSHKDQLQIKRTLEAGVWGYSLKNCSYDQLYDLLSSVAEGKKRVCSEVENIIIDDYLGRRVNKMELLTDREKQVLIMLAEGQSIKEIAEALFISIKTVCTHKQKLFEKMGFSNLVELIRYAMSYGLVA